MGIWIAAGDETGSWDIVNGCFGSNFTGVAWVLASLQAWDMALHMPIGRVTALEAFSKPIGDRMPAGMTLRSKSAKYHLMDVWTTFRSESQDILLDTPQANPALELVRGDAEWLLRKSGLGVLAVGGDATDARAAGLGLSGDGLRERARAYSGLMTVALPFLPGGDSLNLMVEGRTESAIAEAASANRFASRTDGNRYLEPFRDFIGRLTEDMRRKAARCRPLVHGGTVIDSIYCKGGGNLEQFFSELRNAPFFQTHAAEVVAAMNGIADLAAALMPRPSGSGYRLIVPDGFSANLWAGNYRELRHALEG